MSARLLNPRSSLLSLLGDIRYTVSRLKADPLTVSFGAGFQSLRDEWTVVQAQEILFQEELSDAQANVDIADVHLDAFGSRVSKAVLTLVHDDRNHPLYLHFFGDKSLSVFLRPKLGAELEAMRPWLASLVDSEFPSLQALAAELAGLIEAADTALQARESVKAKIRTFYDVGARRQLFDNVNGARKSTHGALAKLALKTVGMPGDYADGFFRSDSGEAASPEPTIESVTKDITLLEVKLAAAKLQLVKLQEAAEVAQQRAAEKRADEQKLADIQRQQGELDKAAKELAGKLKKK